MPQSRIGPADKKHVTFFSRLFLTGPCQKEIIEMDGRSLSITSFESLRIYHILLPHYTDFCIFKCLLFLEDIKYFIAFLLGGHHFYTCSERLFVEWSIFSIHGLRWRKYLTRSSQINKQKNVSDITPSLQINNQESIFVIIQQTVVIIE